MNKIDIFSKKNILILFLVITPIIINTQEDCIEILEQAQTHLKKKNLKEALSKLQLTEVCDAKNVLLKDRQQLQLDIFNALEKQKKEAINNLKKYENEKNAKAECEELKEETERQSKHINEFYLWMQTSKEVDDKSFELYDVLQKKETVNDSLVKIYENLCATDSLNYKNWLKLYYTYTKTNKNSQTLLQTIDKIVGLKEDFGIGYTLRGNKHYDLKKFKKAILDYNKSLELNPKYASAYSNRGNTYLKLNKKNLALLDYKKALEFNKKMSQSITT